MILTLLDTSAASDNVGDEIIMEAVEGIVRGLFPDAYIYKIATHEYMTGISRRILAKSDLSFVCGTNLLSARMALKGAQWKLYPWDAFAFHHAVLVGVGWRHYQEKPHPYTRWLLDHVLHKGAIHSVRDEYTKDKIAFLNRRVVNTACPTMWALTPEHCASISHTKTDTAVVTLTYYHPDVAADRAIFEALKSAYKRVFFWPQQEEDRSYFDSLGVNDVERISPGLRAYDDFLQNEDVDYIGTRLHGGIRAMQKRKRSLIFAVDNRASEIGKDTGLRVLPRKNLDEFKQWIWGDAPTSIQLPHEAIAEWKKQFQP